MRVQKQQSLRLALTVRNPETNLPINLTGASFAVEENTLPFTPSFSLVDASNGIAAMTATKAQMQTLAKEKQYSLKVSLVDSGGNDYVFPTLVLEVQG